MKKIVICGFGSAGYAALASIRRIDPSASVTVIDPKAKDLFHPCGIPYALEGDAAYEGLDSDVNLQAIRVKKIRATAEIIEEGRIIYSMGGVTAEEPFDSCIICTGARPGIPPIEGIERVLRKGLFTFADRFDLDAVLSVLPESRSAIVIGAGAIGIEAASALMTKLPRVTLFEDKDSILPGVLDPDMALLMQSHIEVGGSVIKTKTRAEKFLPGEIFTGISAGQFDYTADLGIISTGFKPDTAIAEKSGIKCNNNGIVVNPALETSMKNVFAAGDCIDGWNIINGKKTNSRLATSAYKQGSAAGINAAGGSAEYKGTACTFVTKIRGLEAAGTGFSTATAKESGYEPALGKIKSKILPDYFKSNYEITIKVLVDPATKLFLGAQAIGQIGASDRINLISMAIEFGIRADEIHRLEMAYCPAVSEVNDPLLKAVEFALRRIK